MGHDYFQEGVGGREALYKISKAYSIYDQEVGYCQGFSFMAAVLLLQVYSVFVVYVCVVCIQCVYIVCVFIYY